MPSVTELPFDPASRDVLGLSEVKDEAAIDGGVRAASLASTASLDRSFVRGIAWLGGVKWIVQLVTWATTIVVARILTPEDYGLLSMGTVLLAFITLLGESGIGMTIVTVRDITPEQIRQVNGGAVLLGVASFLLAVLAAYPVGRFYHAPALPAVVITMSVTMVITSFRIVPGSLMQRDLRFARLAVIDGTQGIVQSLTTLILALLGFRYWSLVVGALLGTTLSTIAIVLSRPYPFQRPRWDTLKPVLPFTRHVVVGRVLWYAYTNSDFIVAGRMLGKQALGAYSYAWTLASMPVDKITALVGGVTPPMFAAVQHDIPTLRRYFTTVTEGLATIVFPLTIGITLVAPEFVPVVFGQHWVFMTVPLQVLAAYASVRAIVPPGSQALLVTGDHRYQMYQTGVAAVALPAAFYVGSRWGTIGIALAWAIVHPIVVYIPFTARVLKRLDLSVRGYLRALWPAVSACVAMTAAVMAVRLFAPPSLAIVAKLCSEIAAGGAAYVATVFAFHRRRLALFLALWRQAA